MIDVETGGRILKFYGGTGKKTPKKGYVTPRLTRHGSIEKITWGASNGPTDGTGRSFLP
jgi:hypothetical protein